jgi:hypothetical protein
MWQQWINGVLGLWVILVPFLSLANDITFTYTMVATGIAIAVLAFWGAAAHQNHNYGGHRTREQRPR